MRARDTRRLEAAEYDLLVVGGGIHGLAIAYDAASRGLKTALVEASDFGSGTSFNHQKTVHGGLRSLQSGHVARAREGIGERRAMARMAPLFLRPLPFLVGTYRSLVRNRVALRAAFRFEAWLGRRRNEGVEPELHLPAPKLISKAATLRLFAGVKPEELTGGAQWYDYQIVENERLVVAFAAAADFAKADVANYVRAVSALKDGSRIAGMNVRDEIEGREFAIRAKAIVNAAGAAAGDVMAMFGVRRPFPLLKAMNLVTSKPASDIALAAPSADGRMLTLVPWRGRAIVGTWQSRSFVTATDLAVREDELDGFIAEANTAFPALKLTRSDVRLVHRGVVPAMDRNGVPELLPAPAIQDHANEGGAGAITVIGVKFSTARGIAARAVDAVAKRLGRRVPPCRTGSTPLPGAAIADHEALAIETARGAAMDLPVEITRRLAALYAENSATIVRLIAERPELATPVAPGCPALGAEVVYAARHEMAVRLADIVIRRTTLGSGGHPGGDAIRGCAMLAARELRWSAVDVEREVADVEAFYTNGLTTND